MIMGAALLASLSLFEQQQFCAAHLTGPVCPAQRPSVRCYIAWGIQAPCGNHATLTNACKALSAAAEPHLHHRTGSQKLCSHPQLMPAGQFQAWQAAQCLTACGWPHWADATPGASCQDLLGVENRESAATREGAAPAAAMGV